jgi:hypothetical protein
MHKHKRIRPKKGQGSVNLSRRMTAGTAGKDEEE